MEFLTVLFAIAGLVWLIPVVQNGRLIVIAMAVLGVGTVFGPEFFHIDGPIQLSLDRLLWFGMFAMAMVGWRMGYVQIPKLHRIDWIVVGIVGWTLISAISSAHQTSGTPPTARWLFYILMPSSMYAIARAIKIETRDVRWMLGGAIGLGLYLAVTAVLEIYGVQRLVFPRFIADAESWQYYGRGRGPLMNPTGNGILMSVALVATSIGVIFSRGRGKMVYAVMTLIVLAGLYATLTRSAWMGGVAAIGLIAFIHSQRWQRVLVVAMVLLLGGASVAGLKDQLVRMKRDKNLTAEDAEQSVKLRPLLAIVSWEMFKDHPLAGHGYGHYFAHNDAYHNDRGYKMPLEQARTYAQHNVFLSLLVDTGLIGFSLFTIWLLVLGGIGWQLARDLQGRPESRWIGLLMLGTLITYFCNGMFHDIMIIPMVHMFLFFLAGVTVTVFHEKLAAATSRESPSRVVVTVTACPDLA